MDEAGLGKLEVLHVIREISPKDRMVTPRYPETYFLWGESALRCIGLAMAAVGKQETASILDFPCGHGRVLRTLKSAFPDAKLTACDIDSDGVDFCERTFDAQGVYSNEDLNQVDLGGNFDMIWVGSLFTHLPEARWGPFLSFLTDRLTPTGLMVFTTHGPWYAQQIREESSPLGGVPATALVEMLRGFDETGFGFAAYPEFDDYGLSLSAPAEVTKRLQALDGMRLALYLERGWRGHQDVVAYQKGFTTPDL